MKRTASLIPLCVLLLLLPFSSAVAQTGSRSLGLSATTFDFSAAPGQIGAGEVYVINEGDTKLSVKVYAANQSVGEDGSVKYVIPAVDENPLNSPASWITLGLPPKARAFGNIPYITLEPSERLPVEFEVTVPEDAVPGDRQAILFFEMFDPETAQEKGTARVNARVGARIKTRVTGTIVEKLAIEPYYLPTFVVGSKARYTFVVRNQGNVDAAITAKLVMLDSANAERVSRKVATQTVFAGTNFEKTGTFDLGQRLGRYTVRAVASYPSVEEGSRGLIKDVQAQRSVWVIPLWLIIVIILLIAAVAIYASWSGGRKAAEKRRREERERKRQMLRQEPDASDYPDEQVLADDEDAG